MHLFFEDFNARDEKFWSSKKIGKSFFFMNKKIITVEVVWKWKQARSLCRLKSELLMSRSRLSLFSASVRSDATLTNRSKNTPKNIWELRTSCRFIKHLLLFDADDYALMIDYTVYLKFLSFHLRRQKEETRMYRLQWLM